MTPPSDLTQINQESRQTIQIHGSQSSNPNVVDWRRIKNRLVSAADPVGLDCEAHRFLRTVLQKARKVLSRRLLPSPSHLYVLHAQSSPAVRIPHPKMPDPPVPTRNADPLHGAATATA
jgi:hypothetical protein